MMIADTMGSYGNMARFKDFHRLHKVNSTTAMGASGELSDLQYIRDMLEELTLGDFQQDDGSQLTAKEVHSYLARVLYNRRSRVNPLWNELVVAGVEPGPNGQAFLGTVDLYGSNYEEDIIATGYGQYIAMPLLRREWRADMTKQEARTLLEKCMTVLFYRHCRQINRYTLSDVTADGVDISEPFELEVKWNYKQFVVPTAQQSLVQ
eukprot:TRINITY_DN49104_c0_g1_i3.p1 TRINITY_DN49104_c0_g1~~TRINITY_DN49104_c0_g1_i3.p1  ORF type:complete len:207 (+),score=111.30 TRINITY_DN49104_c0_g1_i3:217-837(+)